MAIKYGQSIESGKRGYTRRRKATKTRRKECVGHHYAQTNTYNLNKT